MERLRPLNDFIFKKLFGEPESKENLRAFLNAILYNNIGNIKDIEIIKDKELTTDEITNKTGIIDVLAKIDDGTHINIEVQLTDQKNMDRRTLFYWSRIYNRGIIKGEDYSNLNKVITINILDFNFIDLDKFHTEFTLRESEYTDYKLTDVLEIHFIEIPKLEDGSDEKDMLVAWIEFLKNPESEKVRSLEMSVDEIREAKDELIKMSNDDTQRELYEMRAKTLRDKISALNEAERKGIKKGEKNKAIEIAKSLINLGLDKESIAKSTGLDLCEVEKLMN